MLNVETVLLEREGQDSTPAHRKVNTTIKSTSGFKCSSLWEPWIFRKSSV